MIYLKRFPNDKVIIGDAYEYLEKFYSEFDFIWASPECYTHTQMIAFPRHKKQLPDLRLYSIIIFLEKFFDGYYAIENVIPYYKALIHPAAIVDRHYIWANFQLNNKKFYKPRGNLKDLSKEVLCDYLQVDLNLIMAAKLKNKRNHDPKRQALRNCVLPEAGKYILDQVVNQTQKTLIEFVEV